MTWWSNIFTFKLGKFPNFEMQFPAVSMDIKFLQTSLYQNLKKKGGEGLLTTHRSILPLWDLSSFSDISSESLGLLISSVVKLRSWSLLLDRTRSSTAALDLCFVPFRFDFASPFINLACVEARSWDCLTDELLPVKNL